jgi:hypothetical protein
MLYCCMYFKLDLSFYMFVMIFLNKMNGQSCRKKSIATSISIRREYDGAAAADRSPPQDRGGSGGSNALIVCRVT